MESNHLQIPNKTLTEGLRGVSNGLFIKCFQSKGVNEYLGKAVEPILMNK